MTSENNSKTAQVLVVDDTPANLKLLVDILSIAGYSVRPAPSGKLALRSIALEQPDLILLDINMPDMNGYEVAEEIRKNENYRLIPIIFISALDDTSNKVKGFEAGGVDYITKPFQPAEVIARINTHLTIRNLRIELENTNSKLFEENKIRRNMELKLNEHKNNLELVVRNRTQELLEANEILKKEVIIRQNAEKELKESQEKYKAIFENSGEALALIDSDGKLIMINNEFEKLIKSNKASIENKCKWTDFVMNKDGIARLITMEIRRRKSAEYWSNTYYFQILRTTGEIRDVQAIISIIPGINQAIVGITDITEIKNAEDEKLKLREQLTQSQKMEAIGNLAGGIAHDFNNILTGIIGSSEMLQLQIPADNPVHKYIGQILSLSEKASGITKRLLAFSRKQYIDLKPIPVSEIFDGSEKLLKMLLTDDIDLVIEQQSEQVYIYADNNQLYQVIMNLVSNAKDALPNGGEIHIKTSVSLIDPNFALQNNIDKLQQYFKISISDNGIGIPENIKDKIFEPFFTTKEVGKGTGLGLSIVYGIITQHNGFIFVKSEINAGTTFEIYLPLIHSKIESQKLNNTPIQGGNELILIADDSNEVRHFISMFLQMKGYRTLEAKDGEEAISIYNQNKDNIDLIILDVVMPRKNGKEVADTIRNINHAAKIIFISGYTSDIITNKGVNDEGFNFISKPITPNDLYTTVNSVLNS